ncbi:MAG: protein rep [Holosporales bacterium]|nr:protein rep [Holosporales bacterium]
MSNTNDSDDFLLDEKLRNLRAERYIFQSISRLAFPKERVSFCLRNKVPDKEIEVWRHTNTNKAFYAGLMVCGLFWICPVCAAKISERRRMELKSAYDQHLELGGFVSLLTLTFSHKKTDILKDTLLKFSKSTKRFMSGKRYQNFRDKIGFVGSIRAFEITYGSNGFHPHVHIAIFHDNDVDLKALEKELFPQWEKACLSNGLTTGERYGLKLENGEKANDYMAKFGTWGLDREMTKSHMKKGKKDSLSPFDFLRNYHLDGKQKWLNLFIEYGQAMKGKIQLFWSRGLKSRFLIEDKTDEEVAKEKIEKADLLGHISYPDWKIILRHEKRSQILDICEKKGFDELRLYIRNLDNCDENNNKKAF